MNGKDVGDKEECVGKKPGGEKHDCLGDPCQAQRGRSLRGEHPRQVVH